LIAKLSIVYITLNAQQYLEESLKTAKLLSSNLLIVDSGSSDNTLNIAKQLNVEIIQQDWLGFAAQKQLAIDHAKTDWVLFLDADEVLSNEAVSEIKALFSNQTDPQEPSNFAYSLPRENWFQGKIIRHGSWWPDRVTRLVHRKHGAIKQVKVHESWQTEEDVVELQSPLKHYSYENYSQLILKADKYSTLAAEQLYSNGKKASTWAPLTHAIASFIRLFLFKQGFRDGIEGAAIAYTTALASFMKYAKLQELHRLKK